MNYDENISIQLRAAEKRIADLETEVERLSAAASALARLDSARTVGARLCRRASSDIPSDRNIHNDFNCRHRTALCDAVGKDKKMRLIDADALVECINDNKLMAREPVAVRILGIIKGVTTFATPPQGNATAEPCGHWVDGVPYHVVRGNAEFTGTAPGCSLCGIANAGGFVQRTRYCPNCGARMDCEGKD